MSIKTARPPSVAAMRAQGVDVVIVEPKMCGRRDWIRRASDRDGHCFKCGVEHKERDLMFNAVRTYRLKAAPHLQVRVDVFGSSRWQWIDLSKPNAKWSPCDFAGFDEAAATAFASLSGAER